jgi:hypothetical protein
MFAKGRLSRAKVRVLENQPSVYYYELLLLLSFYSVCQLQYFVPNFVPKLTETPRRRLAKSSLVGRQVDI